ncbi:hypothetical protein DIPPA_31327 [Diplonema papillatum]|nr:hypothetical protein DIPPA_31327 [Diplonema papillatum]
MMVGESFGLTRRSGAPRTLSPTHVWSASTRISVTLRTSSVRSALPFASKAQSAQAPMRTKMDVPGALSPPLFLTDDPGAR